MPDAASIESRIFEQLKELRRRGLDKLEAPNRKEIPTSLLEDAAKSVHEYDANLSRSAAIETLLRHEIPLLSSTNYQEQLLAMFILADDLDNRDPSKLSREAMQIAGEVDHTVPSRREVGCPGWSMLDHAVDLPGATCSSAPRTPKLLTGCSRA